MVTSTIHDQTYAKLSWDETNQYMLEIAEAILKSGKKIDRIIALAKGGLTWSRTLYDFLGIKKLSSIQISFYTGIGKTARAPIVTEALATSIQGEHVLLFDDVVDSGETLRMATQYVQMHGAEQIFTAALAMKPWTTIKPDFYGFIPKEWVIFPNETRETMELLKANWFKLGDDEAAVKANLEKVGMTKKEIELFYTLV